MSEIILLRHGCTEANEKHLYCGSTDLPLSEAGKAELSGISYPRWDAMYISSGMLRASQTLRILFHREPDRIEPAFREIDFGAFEMHGYEELREDPAYQAWISGDNEKNVPPGGESGEQMTARVLAAFHQLHSLGKPAVVVTHGGVIAAIMAALYPEEGRSRYAWQPKPGKGYLLKEDGWEALPAVSEELAPLQYKN